MSRSRDPKCPSGRGCRVCGDAGAVRRKREALGDAISSGLVQHDDGRWDESGEWAPSDNACGCDCPDGLCFHIEPAVAGSGWQVQL